MNDLTIFLIFLGIPGFIAGLFGLSNPTGFWNAIGYSYDPQIVEQVPSSLVTFSTAGIGGALIGAVALRLAFSLPCKR